MLGAKEKRHEDDNSLMFKRLASLNPPVYNGAADPEAFKDWIRGMERLFDALHCPEEWRVGLAVLYLRDGADRWWATVRERQYEPRFNWSTFKELIKNQFYPVSLKKKKENEFMQLKQGRMSVQ